MTRLRFRLIPTIFAFAFMAAGCDVSIGENGFSMDIAHGKAQDEWKRTYTVGEGGQLEIVNVNGTITATPADGGKIEVRAERVVKASSDEAARDVLKQIELVETVAGNRVRIETKVPRMRRINQQVRYWVKVPKGLAVNFETVNGGVRVENLDGHTLASTTNGGVRGIGLKGQVKASTTNGGVDITMAEVTGDIQLETTNGGIRLALPRDAKANLEARCTNGGIGVEDGWASLELTEKSRRRFRGTLNGGGPTVSAETTNGGIRITATRTNAETH
jgi:DUF4097 and DUF4098 domain-containing protein YvlB